MPSFLNKELLSENSNYQIIQALIKKTTTVEHRSHQSTVGVILMREKSTGLEKPFDFFAAEETLPVFQYNWVGLTTVEWSKDWIASVRTSSLLGETPVREVKKISFDFNQSEKSVISFRPPIHEKHKGYGYQILNHKIFFDFEENKVFFWPLA